MNCPVVFFFFKQKTAYEMRISDWSSDVCSSDLQAHDAHEHSHDADHKPAFFQRWFMSTNHKDIGTLYLIFAICAGIIGGAVSGLMRVELAEPGIQYLVGWASLFHGGPQRYDESLHLWHLLITAPGLIMIFFMRLPELLGGFGTWFVLRDGQR